MKKIFEQYPPLLLFLTITVFFIWLFNNSNTSVDEPLSQPPLLVAENTKNFQYNEQGNVSNILTAKTVTYYNDERGTNFIFPILTNFKNGSNNQLTAKEANQSYDRSRISLSGEVIGTHTSPTKPHENARFESPTLIYYPIENRAETDEPIKISTPDSTTHAIGTIWLLNQNLFILKKNVRSTYEKTNRP